MQVSSPCQTETMRTETSTIPIPKAAPIGARLDSALARQARARRAYETARKMLAMASQMMEETTKEMEQANAAGGTRKEESWTSDRNGVGRCDTPGHAEPAT